MNAKRTSVAAALATAAAGILAFAAVGAFGTTAAAAAKEKENHCIVPSGVDLNEVWGVSEQIVTGSSPSCTEIGSGERWRPSVLPWFLNHTFEVVPEGFVPAGATPLEDFIAKFVGVRYVVDPGTKQERTVVFANNGDVATASSSGFPVVNPLTLGTIRPLPVGDHVVKTYWRFNAMHCDGFGDDTGLAGNCLPAGETSLPRMAFEVTPARY